MRVWDLRNFKAGSYVASFSYHKGPVTSVEWSPHESSLLATCSDDNTVRRGGVCVWGGRASPQPLGRPRSSPFEMSHSHSAPHGRSLPL